MNCRQTTRKLSAFMDDELDAATSRLVRQHLEGCPECGKYLYELRKVNAFVNGLPRAEMSSDFARKVVERAVEWDTATRDTIPDRNLLTTVLQLVESVVDLFERRKTPDTRTLDEFGDFPPLSMSSVYFKILGEPGRG